MDDGVDVAQVAAQPPYPARTRYLWSPAMHKVLGEQCYFFLLSSTTCRGDELLSHLREDFEHLRINGVTQHIVLGPMDLLVRCWMTSEKRQSLINRFIDRADDLHLDQIHEFRAASVEYKWLSKVQEQAQSQLHSRLASELAADRLRTRLVPLLDSNSAPRPSAVTELLRTHELIEISDPEPRQKIFMFFSAEREDEPRLHDQIASAAKSAELENISVYKGSGFCDYVLKGLWRERNPLIPISAIQKRLAPTGLTGWSLVPPVSFENERNEAIDAIEGAGAQQLAQRLSEPRREDEINSFLVEVSLQSSEVSDRVRAFLDGLDAQLPHLPGVPEMSYRIRRRMESLMAGILSNSRKRVNREASFLVAIAEDANDVVRVLRGRDFEDDLRPRRCVDSIEMLLAASSGEAGSIVESYISRQNAMTQARSADISLGKFLTGDLFGRFEQEFDDTVIQDLEALQQSAVLQMGLEALLSAIQESIDDGG